MQTEESSGTNKLYDLAYYIINSIVTGTVLVIDEFNNALHPLIEKLIIEMYLDPDINKKNAQLLVTSHDTAILDFNVLKREQIWFTDKDKNGVTELYSLNEFDKNKIRDYANYGKNYIEGRFNAIPATNKITFDDRSIE